MIKNGRAFLLLAALFLQACSILETPAAVPTQPEPATVSQVVSSPDSSSASPFPPGFSAEKLRSADYQLGFSDQVRRVPLADGKYAESDPGDPKYFTVFMTDFIAVGDLNADGKNEAAVLVTENYGGSGTFVFLTVYQYVNDEPAFLTSVYIDDRPEISTLSIMDGEIVLEATVHNMNDPLCCPSLPTTRYFWLNNTNLILTRYITQTPIGQPRIITIEAPLDNTMVSGLVRLKGSISIAPFENNLVYRIYDMGGVELSAGPISVDAPDLGAPGTFEKVIDLGNIITNTDVRIEVQDINAANGSLFAMDSVRLQIK